MFAVCVSPSMVPATRSAHSSGIAIATVVGFPSGKHFSAIKAQEAVLAVAAGADEIDMVIDVGAAIAGDIDAVRADVSAVRTALPDEIVLKVIVESAALLEIAGEQTLVDVCQAADRGGRGLREDVDRVSSGRGCLGARRADHGGDRRPDLEREGKRRHPNRCRCLGHARRGRDSSWSVRDARGTRRFRRGSGEAD